MHISWTFLKWVSCDFCYCMWSSTKGANVIPLICPFKLNIDLSKAFVEEPFSTFSYMNILCPFKCEREVTWSLLWRCWRQRRGSGFMNIFVFCSKEEICWMESWWLRTFSRTKWTSSSICFVRTWNTRLLTMAIEPWLSSTTLEGVEEKHVTLEEMTEPRWVLSLYLKDIGILPM